MELVEPPTQFTAAWIATHKRYHGDLKAVIEAGQRRHIISKELDPEITANLIVAMYERPTYARIVLGWDADLSDEDVADLMSDLLGGGLIRPASG